MMRSHGFREEGSAVSSHRYISEWFSIRALLAIPPGGKKFEEE